MSLYLDASALVTLHIETPARKDLLDIVASEPGAVITCALTLVEALALVDRVTDEPVMRNELEDHIRLTWDRLAIVPIDQACLDGAARLMREQPLRLSDAIHLSAALRLPRPVRFATFDPAQITVAMGLGCEIVSN